MSITATRQPWSDVAVFEDLNLGKILEGFLKEKGLDSRTYDDKWFRYFLFLRPPHVTYRVQVRQNEVKHVDELLKIDPPLALQKAIHCPSCGSLHISYPQMTRKFVLPTILLHLGIIFRVIEHECYCDHCHFTWNLPRDEPHFVPNEAKHFPFR